MGCGLFGVILPVKDRFLESVIKKGDFLPLRKRAFELAILHFQMRVRWGKILDLLKREMATTRNDEFIKHTSHTLRRYQERNEIHAIFGFSLVSYCVHRHVVLASYTLSTATKKVEATISPVLQYLCRS